MRWRVVIDNSGSMIVAEETRSSIQVGLDCQYLANSTLGNSWRCENQAKSSLRIIIVELSMRMLSRFLGIDTVKK